MIKVDIQEAQNHFSRYLDQAEKVTWLSFAGITSQSPKSVPFRLGLGIRLALPAS